MIENTTQFVTRLRSVLDLDSLGALFKMLPECQARAIGILQTAQLEDAYSGMKDKLGAMGLDLTKCVNEEVRLIRSGKRRR